MDYGLLTEEEIKKLPKPDPVVKACKGRRISVCEPTLEGNEKKYVMECLEKNWISSHGEFVTRFEKDFAERVNAKYGIACSSGTSALHTALAALHLGPGDEVIMPTFTMIATANAVMFAGAKPVLVDSVQETWNMNVVDVARKITSKTKVILPVHIYGHPVDMNPILELGRKNNIVVLEDAAEAHGALYKGKVVGNLGELGAFSFFANKIIATGEGGMVVTDDDKIAEFCRGFRSYAFSKGVHFWHRFIGANYRITNMQAAIGVAQVERFDDLVEARINNAKIYNSYLNNVAGITTPPESSDVKSVFWMYGILVDEPYPLSRDELRSRLAEHGVETRSFFIPIHWQRPFQQMFAGQKFPVAENLCAKGFYLPSSSFLRKDDIKYICEIITNPKA